MRSLFSVDQFLLSICIFLPRFTFRQKRPVFILLSQLMWARKLQKSLVRSQIGNHDAITPTFSVTCKGNCVFRPSFDMPSFDMLYVNGWKTVWLWNWKAFRLLVEQMTNKWQLLTSHEWGRLSTLHVPDLRYKSNDFSVVDRLSMATSGIIGSLPLNSWYSNNVNIQNSRFKPHRMFAWYS